ncbi:MAG: hypothetical protein VKI81_07210 [Synechococcaceae cyanobacterium]|nr:hypothetical protein [Synechococcaceae cyanobacterium]
MRRLSHVTVRLLNAALEEIQSRSHARAFAAVMDPSRGPAVRETIERVLAVLDATSPDGVI